MPRTEPFDLHSSRYEEWFEKSRYVYESELKAIAHFIPEGKKGVEIGIGSGRFAKPLGIKTGIDPSGEMRRLAVLRGLEVYDGVAEDLPFDDESYDLALMITTICFLDDIEAAFGEVRRILKDGGNFIVGFVDRESILGKKYLKNEQNSIFSGIDPAGSRFREHCQAEKLDKMSNFSPLTIFYKDATLYSAREVLGLLEDAGFRDIETVQTVFGSPNTINLAQNFTVGHGEGAFVIIRSIPNK